MKSCVSEEMKGILISKKCKNHLERIGPYLLPRKRLNRLICFFLREATEYPLPLQKRYLLLYKEVTRLQEDSLCVEVREQGY